MRWTAMVAFATAASLGSPLLGCGDTGPAAKRLQEKFSETWDAMKTWGVEKKDDFVKGAAPKLEELSQKLAEAKASAARTSAQASEQLESAWHGVEQKFDALKTSTGENWAKHRDAFLAAYDTYKQKLVDAGAK